MGSKVPSIEDFRRREYEVQAFDHSAHDIADAVKCILQDTITTATTNLQECICQRMGESYVEKIKLATTSLRKEYDQAAAKKYEELECLVQKTFSIPDYILLPEDIAQATQYTQEDIDKMDREIANLMKKAKRNMLMKAFLQSEQQTLQDIEKMVPVVNKIEARCSERVTLESLAEQIQLLEEVVPKIKKS